MRRRSEDMDAIRIFEDTPQKLTLAAQQTEDLIKLGSLLGENNVNLQANGKLTVNHYVGFVQMQHTRLLIYPKISRNAADEAVYERAFEVLLRLLYVSGFDGVKKMPDPQSMGKNKNDLLEVFIGIFVDELLLRLKRDMNRGYRVDQGNQAFIKGKIDFPVTLKQNSFRKHLHWVRFDHFTENIHLNSILKTVVNQLIKQTKVSENRKKLHQALLWFEDVDVMTLTYDVWQQVTFNRLNSQYQPVFNMARLFFYNIGPSINRGKEMVFSFLVPVNQLFECYVSKWVKKRLQEGESCQSQGPVKYLAVMNEQEKVRLKPDVTVSKGGKVVRLYDAKYKELQMEYLIDDPDQLMIRGVGVSQADIYQMLAYGVRYQCADISLVYPKFLDQQEPVNYQFSMMNGDETITVSVNQIDLEKEVM
ncbi:MAG: hypothetical protein SCK57_03735 [Bacillota bacterium]|nr:hypothetical protein [Bacillota bacterium]MDW7676750.1 hypothetical protein [Bacillota bacterium]